ncbi:MAG: O-antigen ligase family protein [Vicinamibacterales bacterium]
MFGLILIYLLTAIGVVGGLFRPVVGLFVYVGFAMLRPQYMWSFAGDMSGISLYVGAATLVGWALKGFGGVALGRGRVIVLLLLAFTGWAWLSATLGLDPASSTLWVIELVKIVGPFMVGATLLNTRRLIWGMLWVIVAAHGYIAYDMNNWYYFRGYNFIHESGYGFMDNNSFALSLVTALGLAGMLALAARKWPERILALLCALLIVSTVVMSYSRGAMLGLGFVGLMAVVLTPKRPSYVVLMLVGSLATARLMGPQVQERLATVFAEEEERDGSAQSRLDLWKACLEIAADNPLVGIGPRNFPLVASKYGFSAGKEAHSTWMQGAAELGFVGVGLLLLFYLVTMVKLLPLIMKKWTEETREDTLYAIGVFVSLAGFFVTSQFVTMAGLETPYYVAMVAVAIAKSQRVTGAVPVIAPSAPRPLNLGTGLASTFRPRSASPR